ncbi:MAG: sugar phosphate isomerase/epimerase [Lachnospiraceae bacterium]|nr:sugar phosphate isomerase/epimerase [Lachnospiraceae bacterium]
MHKIGIQSMGAISMERLEEGYRRLREAGVDCVDFGFDEYLPCGKVYEEKVDDFLDRPMEELWESFKPHVELAQKYGLTFEQMHAPFPMWQKGRKEISEKMSRITRNTIELCGRMGGKYIVVHPINLAYEYSKQEERDFNMEMYKSLIPTARQHHVMICLENLFLERNGHLMEGICSDFTEAASMVDELNAWAGEELFGFCFDVGHANILGKNLYQSVLTLGERLKILHIHDNDGVSDLHTLPYTFARSWFGVSTEWDGFLRGLREIGYRGVLNFEVFRCMQAFPEELHPAVLKLLADMGGYFSRQILQDDDGNV